MILLARQILLRTVSPAHGVYIYKKYSPKPILLLMDFTVLILKTTVNDVFSSASDLKGTEPMASLPHVNSLPLEPLWLLSFPHVSWSTIVIIIFLL